MTMTEAAIGFVPGLLARVATLTLLVGAALAQEAETHPGPITLFESVRVFDGRGTALSEPANVLIRGNVIERISKDPIAVDPDATTIIKGDGRTLMPGLIDAH